MANILLVEDDESFQKMLKRVLERAGYTVVTACNGHKAIEECRSQAFDVVITDLIMPEMEGLETITGVKECQPDVKIIAISGGGMYDSMLYLNIAEKMGASRTFLKPFEHSDFLEAIEELVPYGSTQK